MTVSADGPEFDAGAVIARALGTVGRNAPVFAALAAALVGLPMALLGWERLSSPPTAPGGELQGAGISALLYSVGGLILQSAVVHASVSDLNGGRARLVECVRTGVRNFLPVLAIALLSAIGVVLGLVLFFIPGVVLIVVWSVAVPSQVVEHRGVFGSFDRSRELTKGLRWNVLGVIVLLWILGFAVSMAAGAAGGLAAAAPAGRAILGLVVSPLASMVAAVISAAGVASIYYELRRVKEGVGPDDLAAVFD